MSTMVTSTPHPLLTAKNAAQAKTTTIFLSFIALGFVFLFAELFLMGHWHGTQLIAVITCGMGLVLSLVALKPATGLRRLVAVLFLVLALSGVYGFLEHREGRGERQQEAAPALQAAKDDVTQEALHSFANNPPMLSPLALSGLAMLGALTLWLDQAEKPS